MGLLDGLAGQLMGSAAGASAQPANVLSTLLETLQGQGDGLSGLMQTLNGAGLGNLVSSWISTGPNLPVSGEQLQQALGGGVIQELAGKAGIAPEAASSQLAELLPAFIDKLTPNGSLPEGGDLLSQGLSLLKQKLF